MIKPNILFIQVDQLTALALKAYGNTFCKAPNLDRLAERGVVFESAYCNFPLCAPSRFSMASGQLCSRIGAFDNAAEFPASIPTYAHYLRRLGYRTALSGKMHFIGPDQHHGFERRLTPDLYPADFSWVPNWGDEGERDRALVEMNGVPCGSRVMRISLAIPRKGVDGVGGGGVGSNTGVGSNGVGGSPAPEPENSTVFVGGLDPTLTEPDLRTHFEAFGELVYVKIPAGKGCGFVQFTRRADAEASIQALNGTTIKGRAVRVDFDRPRKGGPPPRSRPPRG